MHQPAVRCIDLVEVVTEWMEGALQDLDRLKVEEHLAICPDCIEYVRQLRTSIVVLHETPTGPPPPGMRAALLEQFRRRRS